MKTNFNASNSFSQAISITQAYIYHNDMFNTYGTPLLGTLLSCNLTMQTLEMSQEWLATQLGCCVKTVQRHLDNMVASQILTKEFRYHGKGKEQTNKYTMHPMFKDPKVLEQFASRYHEVKLWLVRNSKDLALKALRQIKPVVKKVECAFSALFNGGVVPFNIPSFSSYIYSLRQLGTRLHRGADAVKFPKRKEKHQSEWSMDTEYRTTALKRVERVLKLTPAGAIAFAGYSDAVLEAALKDYERQRYTIKKNFNWFSRVCASKAKELNLPQDVRKRIYLQQLYGIDDKASPKRQIDAQLLASNVGTVPQKEIKKQEVAKPPVSPGAGLSALQDKMDPETFARIKALMGI